MQIQTSIDPTDTRIFQGDCTQVMATMPPESADMILTDPPYLCRYLDRTGRRILNDDQDEWLLPAFEQMFRVLKPNSFCISFYGWHRVDAFMHAWKTAGFRVIEHMVFIKPYDSSARYVRRRHEQAYILSKGVPPIPDLLPPDVMRWDYTGNRLHPTQKPVPILRAMIEAFSRPGDWVLDPFCGSGSTLVAAVQAGRRGIGIELDAQFAEVSRDRLSPQAKAIAA